MARADAPNVEIGYSIVTPGFEAIPDFAGNPIPGPHVEQHGSRGTDQVPRPVRYDTHTDNTHHRIQPKPTEQTPDTQSDQHKHGNRRVGHDVDIGCAEIVIGVLMLMVVMVTVANAVVLMRRVGVVIAAIVQQQCAKQVHEEPDRSQWYSLVEGDWDGMDQPPDTLVPD